jgi:hypothetical protein
MAMAPVGLSEAVDLLHIMIPQCSAARFGDYPGLVAAQSTATDRAAHKALMVAG